jgi:hypothetical protein
MKKTRLKSRLNASLWDKFFCLELKLSYDRQSVGQSVFVSGSHLEPMTRYLFSVWQLGVSWCGAPSLTRGRVCNLVLQFAVSLGSKSRRTHGHILLSHLRLPKPGGPGPRIYIPLKQGGLSVAFYDKQSYGGGILSYLHTRKFVVCLWITFVYVRQRLDKHVAAATNTRKTT